MVSAQTLNLLWVIRCRQYWNRSQCAFMMMACLWGPVSKSSSTTCGSSCLTQRRSFSQSLRSCKPCAVNKLKRWKRWTLVILLDFNSNSRAVSRLVRLYFWISEMDIGQWQFLIKFSFPLSGGELCCTYSWAPGRPWMSDCWLWERQWALETRTSPDQTTARWIY